MRTIRLFGPIVLLWILGIVGAAAQTAASSDCSSTLTSSPAHIVCFDGELKVLAAETLLVHRKAIAELQGSQKSKLIQEQSAWEAGLATRCDLWRWVSPGYALTARPCLTREYVTRIAKLGKEIAPLTDKLQSRAATRSSRYFTIASKHDGPIDAINALAQARYNFPYEAFDLYPPHGVNSRWLVVFASYVQSSNATRARDLARALAISSLPEVWSVPDALFEDSDWQPCTSSTYASRTISCNGKTFDALLNDKATASAILGGRLKDRPTEVTLASSYFTVVKSAESRSEATSQLNALLANNRTVQFDLFPPFTEEGKWEIMIASYTDKEQAEKAAELAKWLGMGSGVRVWQLPQPFKSPPETWRPVGLREIVIKCLAQDARTIFEMYACSGSVVTPQLVQNCVKRGVCELGMGAVSASAYLSSQKLDWNTPLNVQLTLPDLNRVAKCLDDNKKNDKGYVDCAIDLVKGGTQISSCGTKTQDSEFGNCILQSAGVRPDQIECLSKAKGNPLGCVNAGASKAWVDARDCISKHSNAFEAATNCAGVNFDDAAVKLARCLSGPASDKLQCAEHLPNAQSTVSMVRCLRNSASGASALLNCGNFAEANLNPADVECLRKSLNAGDWQATCLGRGLPGPASCFLKYSGDTENVMSCIANGKPAIRDALTAIRCLTNGQQPRDLIAACTLNFVKDPKARQALACASQSSSAQAFGGCIAGSFLGEEEQRLLACATQSPSYAGLALCAAGPKMNQEWMIAAQCAASSGGVPVTAAACTAGWLTLNEFGKCFSQGIGGSGCFGPGNTIVVAVNNAIHDVTKGPGENNEVVKFLRDVGGIEIKDVTWDHPFGGENAFVPKLGRDVGRVLCLGFC
jgi:uncharacterized protein YecT (DUF1311 family)